MPLHLPAPDFVELSNRIQRESDPQRFLELALTAEVDDSRYLHWEQIVRRDPPNGWTHEEWWFALKMRRFPQRRRLPLVDKDGNSFWVNLNDEVLQLSEEIARRAGGIVGGAQGDLQTSMKDVYVVRGLVEESIRSSQLEGASTSRRVAIDMIDSGRAPRTNSETMIMNNYVAMREMKEAADRPLTVETVLRLHRTLTEGTLEDPAQAGRMQAPSDARVSVWAGETCVHVPPVAEELPERLQALCAFANAGTSNSPYLPPSVRAAITHFMFGYDHYFEDGNGRTARTAFYWAMLHSGYWIAEFATISAILRKAPGKYGDAYQYSEDDDGDLTYFVLHQLRVFRRALDELDLYIAAKLAERVSVRQALGAAADRLNFRQAQIIEGLSRGDDSTTSARRIASKYRVTEQTGRNDLRELERLGLLMRLPRSRPAVWVAPSDLADRVRRLGGA